MTFSTTGTLILSYRQVDAILELQLYRLTQLSIDELLKELSEVRANIAEFESILASQAKLRAVIIKELEEIRDKYGDPAAPQIVDETDRAPARRPHRRRAGRRHRLEHRLPQAHAHLYL